MLKTLRWLGLIVGAGAIIGAVLKFGERMLGIVRGWIELKEARARAALAERELRSAGSKATARQLSDEQYGRIVQHLRPYAKEKRHVDVYHAVGSPDNQAIALRLLSAIQAAEWHATYRGEHPYLGFQFGVWVYGPLYPGQTESSSDLIKRALAHAGIEAKIASEFKGPGELPSVIIGGK